MPLEKIINFFSKPKDAIKNIAYSTLLASVLLLSG